MSELTTKELVLRVMDSIDSVRDQNGAEHRLIIEKMHELDIASSQFTTKVKAIAGVISVISATVVTILIKILF